MSLRTVQNALQQLVATSLRGPFSLGFSLEPPWGEWSAQAPVGEMAGDRSLQPGISNWETLGAGDVNQGSQGNTLETAVQVGLLGCGEAS